jgi:uncharacterized membrane protein (UPF0127 family)
VIRSPEAWRTLALAAAAALAPPAAWAECAPDVVDLRDADSELRFRVEVVDDAAERARGLMFRDSLPRFSGMLFVYEAPQPVAFWMRNTLIPLDMLFFDAEGRLVSIKHDAQPLDETPVPGGEAIRYVLEINGGLAAERGIELDAERRPPANEGAPAWPCEG